VAAGVHFARRPLSLFARWITTVRVESASTMLAVTEASLLKAGVARTVSGRRAVFELTLALPPQAIEKTLERSNAGAVAV
jgi:hypothetical protein